VKILIVEDEEAVGVLLAGVLADIGHDVTTVGSGSAALSAALVDEFDLLLCDLMLPDLQGTEIVRALKAQSPRLPVMVISALSRKDWEQPCEDAGASRFLEKPVNAETLRDEVALVEKARLYLNIFIVDTDPIHRTRLAKVLTSFGCEVHPVDSVSGADPALSDDHPASLVLVDATSAGAVDLVRSCRDHGVPTFAFMEHVDDAAQDELMRAGAAFVLGKPVNIDGLLNQAAFLARR
jgi:DNA-binding response OmpR family regulator